jgi:hypothetical protein
MKKRFIIPNPEWPNEAKIEEAVLKQVLATLTRPEDAGGEKHYAVPPNVVKGMADIATSVWKAKGRMLDDAGEVREDMKRVYRHIESALDTLSAIGVELKDHTGSAFDYGLPLKVVTTQDTPGITRETVLETLRPTVFWQKQIIQMGEVVVGTPPAPPPSTPPSAPPATPPSSS